MTTTINPDKSFPSRGKIFLIHHPQPTTAQKLSMSQNYGETSKSNHKTGLSQSSMEITQIKESTIQFDQIHWRHTQTLNYTIHSHKRPFFPPHSITPTRGIYFFQTKNHQTTPTAAYLMDITIYQPHQISQRCSLISLT